jgi:hypothetical protein
MGPSIIRRELDMCLDCQIRLMGKEAHNMKYNYMKITIFTLIGMIRLIGFNIQDIQIHVNIQFCNQ